MGLGSNRRHGAALLVAAIGLALMLAACSDAAKPAALTYEPTTALRVPDDPTVPPDDPPPATPDAVADADAAPEADVEPPPEPDDGPPPEPDVPPVEPPPLTTTSGETDGSAVIVHPEALEGLFIFGIGAEAGTALTQIGNTAAGMLALPAVLELSADELVIRVVDKESLQPINGQDGVIESYATEALPDGRVRVDFGSPIETITINLFQSCVYELEAYTPYGAPLYADGLLTWAADEYFEPHNCGGWVGPSDSVNVHFLRRSDANPDYEPRAAEADSPFGFFMIEREGEPHLTRLPGIGEGEPDGAVTYYLSGAIPPEFKDAVVGVFDGWNDSFEEAIGQRPFAVEDAPADMLAWDPRYRVVLWDGSLSQGAIAPFIEDPFTGEMFETHVILWLGDLTELVERYTEILDEHPQLLDNLAPPGATAALWSGVPELAPELPMAPEVLSAPGLPPNVLRRRALNFRPLGHQAIASYLDLEIDEQTVGEYIVADFLVHELGHNLGLRHNFVASADSDHTPSPHSATSTMDYVVGMPRPGTYDQDAMRYAYGAGALQNDYLYCSDEHIYAWPECQPWDFGHPVRWQVDYVEALATEVEPGASWQELNYAAEEEEWNRNLKKVRQFVNTTWELWDPELDLPVFDWLLGHVMCNDCGAHAWFRSQWALYLLYTRHVVQELWKPGAPEVWYDFPELQQTQAATLMTAFEGLVLDPAQPYALKETIINKLPTSNVVGAGGLLDALAAALAAIESPSGDEQALLQLVNAAQNQ